MYSDQILGKVVNYSEEIREYWVREVSWVPVPIVMVYNQEFDQYDAIYITDVVAKIFSKLLKKFKFIKK